MGEEQHDSQQQQQQQQDKRCRAAESSVVDDYECAVCLGLLLDPVVAPCGHDVCQHCYHALQRHSASASVCGAVCVCPLCRFPLPSNLAVCLRLKKTIERLYPVASAKRRQEVALQLAADQSSGDLPGAAAQQLPTYPLGPYPPHLFAQWAAATAPQQSPFTMMFAAIQFVGGMQLTPASGASPVPVPQQAASLAATCSTMHDDGDSSALREAPSPAVTAAPVLQQPDTCRRPAWQSTADSPMRLQIAKAIVSTLQQRGWHLMLGPKLADAVRLLELVLYRTATSREAYLDESDLSSRIVAAVLQRAAAATARRTRLEAAAVTAASLCPAARLQQQQQQHNALAAAPALPV